MWSMYIPAGKFDCADCVDDAVDAGLVDFVPQDRYESQEVVPEQVGKNLFVENFHVLMFVLAIYQVYYPFHPC